MYAGLVVCVCAYLRVCLSIFVHTLACGLACLCGYKDECLDEKMVVYVRIFVYKKNEK